MANVFHTKQEMVDFTIKMLSNEHIRENFRWNLMNEDNDLILYILNNLIDNHTNNVFETK